MRKIALALALIVAGCNPTAETQARRAVAAMLKDPDSAKFRALNDVGQAICGEVNGRNGYGAYAGFEPFVFFPSDGAVFFVKKSMPKKEREAWAHFCNPQVPAQERVALFERTPRGIRHTKYCEDNPKTIYCMKIGDTPIASGPPKHVTEDGEVRIDWRPRTVPTCTHEKMC